MEKDNKKSKLERDDEGERERQVKAKDKEE